ncbi:MAG: hypothetical protein R3B48_20850 [Kofleriaceae bacterium]
MSSPELVFAALWQKDGQPFAGHLPLLGLLDCARELSVLREAVVAAEAPAALVAMLADRNWRPTLAAATAIALGPRDGRYAAALWSALDGGTWVAPQVAVVLEHHDPEFTSAATLRVARRCALDGSRWGEATRGQPDGKALAALLQLLERALPEEVARWRSDPTILDALARSVDRGEEIARRWRERLRDHLATHP